MIRLLGELVVLVLVAYVIWAWVKPRPRVPASVVDTTNHIRCLPAEHPVNIGGVVSSVYIRTWYVTHDMSDELALVSGLGSEAEMKCYMTFMAKWTKSNEMK